MNFIILAIISGVVGTAGMTTFLWLIDRSGKVNANMIRAVGSAVTRSYETSLFPGSLIHFSSGIIFGLIYLYIFQMLQLNYLSSFLIAGGIIGLAHGFAFSFIMVILAEHHPVDRFQNAGFQVAIAHFVAHIVYGALVGLVAGFFSVNVGG